MHQLGLIMLFSFTVINPQQFTSNYGFRLIFWLEIQTAAQALPHWTRLPVMAPGYEPCLNQHARTKANTPPVNVAHVPGYVQVTPPLRGLIGLAGYFLIAMLQTTTVQGVLLLNHLWGCTGCGDISSCFLHAHNRREQRMLSS
jgi:hypothetical protein